MRGGGRDERVRRERVVRGEGETREGSERGRERRERGHLTWMNWDITNSLDFQPMILLSL